MQNVHIEIIDNRGQAESASEYAGLNDLVVAEQGSLISNLALANTIASTDLSAKSTLARRDARSRLNISILSNAVNRVQNPQPMKARCAIATLSNSDLAHSIAALKAAIAAFTAPGDDA